MNKLEKVAKESKENYLYREGTKERKLVDEVVNFTISKVKNDIPLSEKEEIEVIATCEVCRSKIIILDTSLSYLRCPYCNSRQIKLKGFDL